MKMFADGTPAASTDSKGGPERSFRAISAILGANGIIGDSFAPHRRAFAAGVMFAGIGVGSAVTPPFVAWCMLHCGWKAPCRVQSGPNNHPDLAPWRLLLSHLARAQGFMTEV